MRLLFLIAVLLVTCGCRVGAPMMVWSPPELESAVGKRVGISHVKGPKRIAEPLRERMISMAPTESGRSLVAVSPQAVDQQQTIRLVSATDDVPSDLATASVARREGFDYLLSGEIVGKNNHRNSRLLMAADPSDQPLNLNEPLSVSWRLLSVIDDRHAGGKPVVIDLVTAKQRYPDLALLDNDEETLTRASVREAYRLITPTIKQDRVQLASTIGLPGSRQLRRGNALALTGKWGEAEQVWQSVSNSHPLQVAAIHNLALAAAASQNFSEAKSLARKAVRRLPTALHKKTLVWIEQKQRDYHQSFNLPDPLEGWFVSRKNVQEVGTK